MTSPDLLNVALIGCGVFGRQHAAGLRQVPEARLRLVFDTDSRRAESAAGEFDARPATSLDEVLNDDSFDAVVIATPTDTHFGLASAAIAAGKHVLVEKPLVLDIAELNQLERASADAGLVLMAGQSLRFQPTLRTLWSAVRDGELGRPVLFNWVSNSSRAWPGGWRGWQSEPDRSGGMPFHLGIHGIDYAIWLIDDRPERVFAQGTDVAAPGAGIYDYHHIAVRFAGGANALIEYHSGLPGRTSRHGEFRLYGTGGQASWKLDDDGMLLDADGGRPFVSEAAYSIREELAHFVACCRGEQTPLVTIEQVRMGLAVAVAARRSLELGRVIPVNEIMKGS